MTLSEMYVRVVPSKMPKVGDQKAIPTGPAEATIGTITAIDPEGVILLKLVSGVMLAGYCAKQKPGIDVDLFEARGITANQNEEMWIFNTVEPR